MQARDSIHQGAASLSRLSEMGIPPAALTQAIGEAWARYGADCTAHDVASAVGTLMWSKGTRFLRDRLVPLGWTVGHARNLERTVHPDGTIYITIAQGTEATGQDQPVRTRYKRGPVMREAIAGCQLDFSSVSPEEFPPTDAAAPAEPRVLLYHIDRHAGEIRVELSSPDGMDEEGYVNSWSERIFLDSVLIRSTRPMTDDHGTEEPYEVKVQARSR